MLLVIWSPGVGAGGKVLQWWQGWPGLSCWRDETDLLASTSFGLSFWGGQGERTRSHLLGRSIGQARTDGWTASRKGVKNQDSLRVSHPPEGFLNIVGRHSLCRPPSKASVKGPKCRGGDHLPPLHVPLPLQVFPELFKDLARLTSL